MIPKVIHYCWFGRTKKPELVMRCIQSWKDNLPNFEIHEWNEDNFDVEKNDYTRQAYRDRKWAFVSDYARLKVLHDNGGVYLDTDMYVLRDFTELLEASAFIGKEDDVYVNAAILGSTKGHPFIVKMIEKYSTLRERIPIPILLSEVIKQESFDVKVYPKVYFYPYSFSDIKHFNGKNAPAESYTVHMWNYSWASLPVKIARKLGIYFFTKDLAKKLGIKSFLKKCLKME